MGWLRPSRVRCFVGAASVSIDHRRLDALRGRRGECGDCYNESEEEKRHDALRMVYKKHLKRENFFVEIFFEKISNSY